MLFLFLFVSVVYDVDVPTLQYFFQCINEPLGLPSHPQPLPTVVEKFLQGVGTCVNSDEKPPNHDDYILANFHQNTLKYMKRIVNEYVACVALLPL